jgi:hypothetical protein
MRKRYCQQHFYREELKRNETYSFRELATHEGVQSSLELAGATVEVVQGDGDVFGVPYDVYYLEKSALKELQQIPSFTLHPAVNTSLGRKSTWRCDLINLLSFMSRKMSNEERNECMESPPLKL